MQIVNDELWPPLGLIPSCRPSGLVTRSAFVGTDQLVFQVNVATSISSEHQRVLSAKSGSVVRVCWKYSLFH